MPKIKSIISNEDKPTLIEFQNGKLELDQKNNLELACFKDRRENKKLLGVANGDMIYSGEINSDSLFNNFLVVSKKGGKELHLVEVDTCILKPLFREKDVTTSPLKEQTTGDLRKQFGSKKAKRFTEQQERLKTNIDNVKETLENTIADIDVVDISSNQPQDPESLYKPKINRDASSRDHVYQLSDLVPNKVLDSLQEKTIEIIQSDSINDYKLTPVMKQCIVSLKSLSLTKEDLLKKCKILIYTDFLLNFMNTPTKKMTKRYLACDCSLDVDKHIKENYMVNGQRPLNMRDKCLCYILVLIMIAMDYEFDLQLLSSDTKIGLKKMTEFARNLGFSQSSKSKTSIILKIPVPPPVPPNLKRKR